MLIKPKGFPHPSFEEITGNSMFKISFGGSECYRKGSPDILRRQIQDIKKFEHAYPERRAMLKEIFECDLASQPFILAEEIPPFI